MYSCEAECLEAIITPGFKTVEVNITDPKLLNSSIGI